MLNRLLGIKIGMSQMFDENRKVVPVTAIEVGEWFVTQIKTKEKDGYAAIQLGLPRNRHRGKSFSEAWLKSKKDIFLHIKEVLVEGEVPSSYSVGKAVGLKDFNIVDNDRLDVAGASIGIGFQGVVKRWNFTGGPDAHGSTFHRAPGSIGNMCTQGNVIKGKKLPGHCGCKRITVQNLKVVKIDQERNCLFIKGAVPGKKNTLLFIRKQG